MTGIESVVNGVNVTDANRSAVVYRVGNVGQNLPEGLLGGLTAAAPKVTGTGDVQKTNPANVVSIQEVTKKQTSYANNPAYVPTAEQLQKENPALGGRATGGIGSRLDKYL